MRRSTGHRRGAAACELAILLPFLALMFAVAVDYCRVFYYTQTVEGCAEAGALYASGAATRGPAVSAADAARQAALAEGVSLDPPLTAENVTVNITGSTASVTVTYVFQTLTSYPGASGPVTLTRTVTMPVMPRAPGAP
jgi:Flp pilus assembly protein TadG